MSRETRVPNWLVSGLGLPFFAAFRIAQEYSARKELAKINDLGQGVDAEAGLVVANGGHIRIGRNVSLGASLRLFCYKGGSIDIEDDVVITSHCIIAADRGRIRIGSDTLIGPGVSIIASNHGIAAKPKMRLQPNTVRNIDIGPDVWLGKGVSIIAGAQVAEGCVIGANAVVNKTTEPYGIYAGVPIRKIGERRDAS